MGSPFLHGFAFIVLDGDTDLPQYLLIDLADRRSQRPDSGRSVEVKNRHEVLMAEILFRLQSAAGHQGIGDADGCGSLKLHLDVKFIIIL